MASPTITTVHRPGQLDCTYDIVVLDTNILIYHQEFIPDLDQSTPPTFQGFDFNHKHFVIPSVVQDELDKLKGSHTVSAWTLARNCINQLLGLYAESYDFTLEDSFDLRNNLHLQYRTPKGKLEFMFSIFYTTTPAQAPPFCPNPTDMDGQIIASALQIYNTGWYQDAIAMEKINLGRAPTITLLSDDKNFCVRARSLGIKTELLGHISNEYTGRRTVRAPKVLSSMLIQEGEVPLSAWEKYLPGQRPLQPNEYVVFQMPQPKKSNQSQSVNRRKRSRRPNKPAPIQQVTANPQDLPLAERFAFVGRYDESRQAIVRLKYPGNLPLEPQNIGQAIHLDALQNPDIHIVIVDGSVNLRTSKAAVISYRNRESPLPDSINEQLGFK